MRIVIFGAGAIGGFIGARLLDAGADVAFVARGRTLEALRAEGLRVSSPLGDLHLREVEASDDLAALGPADAVVLAVKAWQVPGVATTLGPLLGPEGAVLPLQNGIEAPTQIAAALGESAALGGLCKIVCQVESPGHVVHAGGQPYVALGELDDRSSTRTENLRSLLGAAGVTAEIPSSIRVAMWEKFLFICSVSGLGSVTRLPLGVLRAEPESRDLLERIMREIFELAAAEGAEMQPEILPRTMAFVDSLPESTTASMQRDIAAGLPSELESQNGAVARLARERGVAAPVNTLLYEILLPLERLARSR